MSSRKDEEYKRITDAEQLLFEGVTDKSKSIKEKLDAIDDYLEVLKNSYVVKAALKSINKQGVNINGALVWLGEKNDGQKGSDHGDVKKRIEEVNAHVLDVIKHLSGIVRG